MEEVLTGSLRGWICGLPVTCRRLPLDSATAAGDTALELAASAASCPSQCHALPEAVGLLRPELGQPQSRRGVSVQRGPGECPPWCREGRGRDACHALVGGSRGPDTPLPAAATPESTPPLGSFLFLVSLFLPTLHLKPGIAWTSSTLAWLPSRPRPPENYLFQALVIGPTSGRFPARPREAWGVGRNSDTCFLT